MLLLLAMALRLLSRLRVAARALLAAVCACCVCVQPLCWNACSPQHCLQHLQHQSWPG